MASERAGKAFIHRNGRALPRVRLAESPLYAKDVAEASAARSIACREPINCASIDRRRSDAPSARGLRGLRERRGSSRRFPSVWSSKRKHGSPAYLVVSDRSTRAGRPLSTAVRPTIYPAYCAFRAVYLPQGRHTVVFEYSPAGFKVGLSISLCGVLVALGLWFLPRQSFALADEHRVLNWPVRWKAWYFGALVAIVLISIPGITPQAKLTTQNRWKNSFHGFTWGAGIEAMKLPAKRPAPAAVGK